jgi:hypothetical protein
MADASLLNEALIKLEEALNVAKIVWVREHAK